MRLSNITRNLWSGSRIEIRSYSSNSLLDGRRWIELNAQNPTQSLASLPLAVVLPN